MAKKHEKTRAAIFEKPTKATIKWAAIEALFVFLGGTRAFSDLMGSV